MEVLADSSPVPMIVSLPPAKKSLPHAFTRENAAEFTKKGLIVRAANRKARLERLTISPDPYVNKRLARVRAQLERIDEMMEQELDPQRLDRLASAQARLSVQEFALANRPMPGSRRPGRESTKAPSLLEPSE